MSRSLAPFFLLLLIAAAAAAQEPPARARHAYEAGLRAEAKHDRNKAEAQMLRAIREDHTYTDAYIAYGGWLLEARQYKAAAAILSDGEKLCPGGQKIFAKALAKSLLCSGNVTAALQRIPAASKDTFWKSLAAQAAFMQDAAKHADAAGRVTPIGPLWGINTRDPELFPGISADGKTLYFTRRINGIDEDFFYAKPEPDCGGWASARNMGSPPNTLQQEAAQSISPDGHYLFFMRCDNRSLSGWDQGGCDLYMAYRADSIWSTPLSFGATINTPGYEGMPCLSSDNRELYFVSDREGGYGGLDIWSARFEHGLWQAPRNLGPGINTAGDETAPFIYADNATLYFASTGRPGMGGSDLYISRKADDTTWGNAVNMGAPLNTPFDEASLSLNAAGDTALFASDRDSLAGNFDLYQYPLPPAFRPAQVMYVKGFVYDSIGKGPLNYASIYITDSASGKELYQVQSNRGDGSYTIALATGGAYHLFIDRIGFQSMNDSIRISPADAGGVMQHSFALLPADYQKPVTDSLIGILYFPKNAATLGDSARAIVAAAVAPWKGVAGITILVNGYTDNSGTPMLNEQLSYTRAQTVAAAISAAGLPPDAIQPHGWGEANPKAENDTDEHRDTNRRVEIIVRQ